MDFADKIKFLREKILGMSRTELAKKLSVSRISIYNWENGISKPSVENIKTISLLCGITTDYLIKENHPLEVSLYNIDNQAYRILNDLVNYFRERNNENDNEKQNI